MAQITHLLKAATRI